jgi:transcriptional regulator with XRE-family HTH domain
MISFSEWMQAQCDRAGVNVTQLSKIIDVPQGTLSRIYSGKSKNPHLWIIERLEKYFDVKFSTESNALKAKQDAAPYEAKPSIVVAGIKIESTEAHLLKLYRKLSTTSQTAIDLMINRLYELEHPSDIVATGKKLLKKEKI